MIDENGDYKLCVEGCCKNMGWEKTPTHQQDKCKCVFYKNEIIRLINEGGEKNLLKAKSFINLLIQLENE